MVLLFACITLCFLFSEMVLAGAFARWYWTFDKGDVPCCILAVSFSNAVFYHLGTVAFGSFIIAVIRMIRTIVSYVESKLKMYNNDLTRCLICLCKCCLWCLEKFMRFINRNAYIMCAIKNTNFCSSAKDAFSLLMRNILRYYNVVDRVLCAIISTVFRRFQGYGSEQCGGISAISWPSGNRGGSRLLSLFR